MVNPVNKITQIVEIPCKTTRKSLRKSTAKMCTIIKYFIQHVNIATFPPTFPIQSTDFSTTPPPLLPLRLFHFSTKPTTITINNI